MDTESVKGKCLTKDETKFLLQLIEASSVITSKTTNASSNKMKNEEWIRLTERFNATGTICPRTPQQLRLKWENLKKNSRKRSTKIRMNQIKTGGGPSEFIPPDEILDRVTGLLGSTASGFTVPFGGDSEPLGSDVGGGGSGSSGDGLGEVRVSVVDFIKDTVSVPLSVDSNTETVHKVFDIVDPNITPCKNKRFTFNTPRTVRKRFKTDESRIARNAAIAEYYVTKKKYLDVKLSNLDLENDSIKIRNKNLELETEKLKLETEKLKLELEKLKSCNNSV